MLDISKCNFLKLNIRSRRNKQSGRQTKRLYGFPPFFRALSFCFSFLAKTFVINKKLVHRAQFENNSVEVAYTDHEAPHLLVLLPLPGVPFAVLDWPKRLLQVVDGVAPTGGRILD